MLKELPAIRKSLKALVAGQDDLMDLLEEGGSSLERSMEEEPLEEPPEEEPLAEDPPKEERQENKSTLEQEAEPRSRKKPIGAHPEA